MLKQWLQCFCLVHAKVAIKKADTRVSGVDRSHWILFFPLGQPNMKEAIDRAIEKYPGAIGLCDGVVKSRTWWALLYGQNAYIVEGTPLYAPAQTSLDVKELKDKSNGAVFLYHEVTAGDTLESVAELYGVSSSDIINWNGMDNSTLLEGTKLLLCV